MPSNQSKLSLQIRLTSSGISLSFQSAKKVSFSLHSAFFELIFCVVNICYFQMLFCTLFHATWYCLCVTIFFFFARFCTNCFLRPQNESLFVSKQTWPMRNKKVNRMLCKNVRRFYWVFFSLPICMSQSFGDTLVADNAAELKIDLICFGRVCKLCSQLPILYEQQKQWKNNIFK